MRGLTIIIVEADTTRLRSALGLALSHAALGGGVRLFFDTAAVSLLRPPIADADDARWVMIGMPDLAGLIDEALDAGVAISACQAGLVLCGAEAAAFDPRIGFGGMIALLTGLNDDRLVAI